MPRLLRYYEYSGATDTGSYTMWDLTDTGNPRPKVSDFPTYESVEICTNGTYT